MELAIKDLKLGEASSVIDYNSGEDPYRMIQVHDYRNISFFRMNPNVRSASKKTIEVFATAYPELLKEKFFVNVPLIMGWIYTAMKALLSPNTTRKFHPITNGVNLGKEFPSTISILFPKAYGGQGSDLKGNGVTVKLDVPAESKPKAEPAKEAAVEEPAKETGKEPAKELDDEEPVSSDAEAKAIEAGEIPADAGGSSTDGK